MDWRAFYLVKFLIRFSLPAYHTTKRLYMASSFQFYMRKVHPKKRRFHRNLRHRLHHPLNSKISFSFVLFCIVHKRSFVPTDMELGPGQL